MQGTSGVKGLCVICLVSFVHMNMPGALVKYFALCVKKQEETSQNAGHKIMQATSLILCQKVFKPKSKFS